MHALRIVSWNLNAAAVGRAADEVAFLSSLLRGREPAIVALQEVTGAHWAALRAAGVLDAAAWSLHLRRPRRYDSANRGLGCVVGLVGEGRLANARLVPDTPLPERALVADVEVGGRRLVAGSVHVLTGSGFGHAKPVMLRAWVRFLEETTGPVVFGVDRNAPKVDRRRLEECEWWWPRANEEPLAWGASAPHRCRDAFRRWLEAAPGRLEGVAGDGPLATTHVRGRRGGRPRDGAGPGGGTPCRYDAVYVTDDFAVRAVEHPLEASRAAGSDHSAVVVDLA